MVLEMGFAIFKTLQSLSLTSNLGVKTLQVEKTVRVELGEFQPWGQFHNTKTCTSKCQNMYGIFNVQFHKNLNFKIFKTQYQKMVNFIIQIYL